MKLAQISDIRGGAVSLAGKVAVVTGASSGIGQAIRLAFAQAGADLVVSYRHNRAGIDETVRRVTEAGRVGVPVQVDVSRAEDIERLAEAVQERFGRADVWTNNAGADILTGRGATLSPAEKARAAPHRGCPRHRVGLMDRGQAHARRLRRGNPQHVVGSRGPGDEGENPILYSVAKGAIASFSRSLAREGGTGHPGEHPGPWLHRDRLRRGG
jgi:NAD(P)-dependent dehydrogenase (short-subunit alcohol dehydrogenase family)